MLIQVSPETEGDKTWDRELRALESAKTQFKDARAILLTLDAKPPQRSLPNGISWMPAARWLLEED